MPDLLLELFSEEIPARMQPSAAEDLRKLVTDKLVEAGLVYEGAKAFATPRRLALTVQGVPARQPDVKEERKGPRVGAPEGAIDGFLKAAGLTIDRSGQGAARQEGRLLRRGDREAGPGGDRGDRRDRAGSGEAVSRGRSRCAGALRRRKPGALSWVRPLHSIVATFGPETEEPDVVRVRGRRHRRRRRHPRPPLPRARRHSRCGASTTTWRSSRRRGWCSTPRGARR